MADRKKQEEVEKKQPPASPAKNDNQKTSNPDSDGAFSFTIPNRPNAMQQRIIDSLRTDPVANLPLRGDYVVRRTIMTPAQVASQSLSFSRNFHRSGQTELVTPGTSPPGIPPQGPSPPSGPPSPLNKPTTPFSLALAEWSAARAVAKTNATPTGPSTPARWLKTSDSTENFLNFFFNDLPNILALDSVGSSATLALSTLSVPKSESQQPPEKEVPVCKRKSAQESCSRPPKQVKKEVEKKSSSRGNFSISNRQVQPDHHYFLPEGASINNSSEVNLPWFVDTPLPGRPRPFPAGLKPATPKPRGPKPPGPVTLGLSSEAPKPSGSSLPGPFPAAPKPPGPSPSRPLPPPNRLTATFPFYLPLTSTLSPEMNLWAANQFLEIEAAYLLLLERGAVSRASSSLPPQPPPAHQFRRQPIAGERGPGHTLTPPPAHQQSSRPQLSGLSFLSTQTGGENVPVGDDGSKNVSGDGYGRWI